MPINLKKLKVWKKANRKKINAGWDVSCQFKNTQNIGEHYFGLYMLIQTLNMPVEKIPQPQNSGYLQGENEKGNRIKGTQRFLLPSTVLFLIDIWQMLLLVELRDGDKHMKNVQHH